MHTNKHPNWLGVIFGVKYAQMTFKVRVDDFPTKLVFTSTHSYPAGSSWLIITTVFLPVKPLGVQICSLLGADGLGSGYSHIISYNII